MKLAAGRRQRSNKHDETTAESPTRGQKTRQSVATRARRRKLDRVESRRAVRYGPEKRGPVPAPSVHHRCQRIVTGCIPTNDLLRYRLEKG